MKIRRKNVDAAREARLWIRDVIIPVVGIGGYLWTRFPEQRHKILTQINKAKFYVKHGETVDEFFSKDQREMH